MVSNNGSDQSQDDLDLAQELNAGDNGSQQVVFDDEPESGAGNEPRGSTPQPRVYSEEEVRAIQSAGDRRVADMSKAASQAILTVQRERAQRTELDARASDAAEVDNGDLTPEAANSRSVQRQNDRTSAARTVQANAEQQSAYEQAEPVLRHAYALELAEEHQIDVNLLTGDTTLLTPEAMSIQAQRLSLEKREKALTTPEVFDGGASGIGGASVTVDNMDGLQKVTYALGRPAPKKR